MKNAFGVSLIVLMAMVVGWVPVYGEPSPGGDPNLAPSPDGNPKAVKKHFTAPPPGISISSDPEMILFQDIEVVTASRTARPIRQLPVTMHVITREDIRNNHYTNLIDALRDAPGIRVSRPGSGTDGDTFMMRGMYGNYYTKLFLNGLPLMPSVVGGMPIAEQINMRNVERIEILYGPAAALYGSDAMAGVINIITYTPETNEVDLFTKAGQDGYWYNNGFASVGLGKGKDKLRLNFYGLYGRQDDLNIDDGVLDRSNYNYASWNQVPFKLGDLPRRSHSLGVQGLYKEITVAYDYMYRSDNSSVGQRSDWYFYDDEKAIWGESIDRLAVQHSTNLSDEVKLKTQASYLRYRLDNQSYYAFIFPSRDPNTFGQRNTCYKYQASDDLLYEEVLEWNVTETIDVIGGGSIQYSGVLPKTNDLAAPFDTGDYHPFGDQKPPADPIFGDFGNNPHTFYAAAAFLEGAYHTEKIDLVGGARFDHFSNYGSTINPRFAAQYNFTEKTSVRASYGEAFKAPSPYYTYGSVAGLNSNGTINYMGVPSLTIQPEELKSFEVGVRHLLTPSVSLEAVGYHTVITNLITAITIPIDPVKYPNSGSPTTGAFGNDKNSYTIINGVDAIVRWADIIPDIKLNSDFSVGYAKGKEHMAYSDTIDDIRETPEWSFKWRLSARPVKRLYIGVDQTCYTHWYGRDVATEANYKDPWYGHAGYYVMDLTANYEIIDNLKVFFEVQNVLDRAYGGITAYSNTNLKYNPQPGRTFLAGVEYRF